MAENNFGPAKNYDPKDDHLAGIFNAFQYLKQKMGSSKNWNMPVEQMDGLTLIAVGQDKIKLTHSKYIVFNPYTYKMKELPEADEFLNALEKGLIKKYKELTDSPLKLKLFKQEQDIQEYSKISGDVSWVFSGGDASRSSRYMAKGILITARIYTVQNLQNITNQ